MLDTGAPQSASETGSFDADLSFVATSAAVELNSAFKGEIVDLSAVKELAHALSRASDSSGDLTSRDSLVDPFVVDVLSGTIPPEERDSVRTIPQLATKARLIAKALEAIGPSTDKKTILLMRSLCLVIADIAREHYQTISEQARPDRPYRM